MLDRDGFEDWAVRYDRTVDESKASGNYPFCGYDEVQARVESVLGGASGVIDLGVGTARLTSRLYDAGIKICGVDFSLNMLAAARAKMPDAALINADLRDGLPVEIAHTGVKYSAASALYSIHHLTDAQKLAVIYGAKNLLGSGGLFVIGDVAFRTRADRDECKRRAGDAFDDAEHYCIFDELERFLPGRAEFEKISFCAGVITIEF